MQLHNRELFPSTRILSTEKALKAAFDVGIRSLETKPYMMVLVQSREYTPTYAFGMLHIDNVIDFTTSMQPKVGTLN